MPVGTLAFFIIVKTMNFCVPLGIRKFPAYALSGI